MRVRALLLLGALAVVLAGCSHSVAGEEDSTSDFGFTIVQKADPPVMSGFTRVDVPFAITITNKTDIPVTVSRIALQSFETGDYQIPFRSRPFEKVIAPGAKETFEFWANAVVTDPALGTRAPLTLRTMVDFESPNGARHEVFVRGVNGRVGFGLQRPVG